MEYGYTSKMDGSKFLRYSLIHSTKKFQLELFPGLCPVYITKLFLGIISFPTVTANKERRAIHDMVATTVIIKVDDTSYKNPPEESESINARMLFEPGHAQYPSMPFHSLTKLLPPPQQLYLSLFC